MPYTLKRAKCRASSWEMVVLLFCFQTTQNHRPAQEHEPQCHNGQNAAYDSDDRNQTKNKGNDNQYHAGTQLTGSILSFKAQCLTTGEVAIAHEFQDEGNNIGNAHQNTNDEINEGYPAEEDLDDKAYNANPCSSLQSGNTFCSLCIE